MKVPLQRKRALTTQRSRWRRRRPPASCGGLLGGRLAHSDVPTATCKPALLQEAITRQQAGAPHAQSPHAPNRTKQRSPDHHGLVVHLLKLVGHHHQELVKVLGLAAGGCRHGAARCSGRQGSRQEGDADRPWQESGGARRRREAGQGARSRDQADGSRLWGYARPGAAHDARNRLRSLLGAFKRRSPAGCRGRAPARGRARGPAARRWAVAATGRALHTLLATHCIAAVVCEQRGILRLCLQVWAGGL